MQRIIDYVENPEDYNNDKEKLIDTILEILWEATHKIELDTFVLKLSPEDIKEYLKKQN